MLPFPGNAFTPIYAPTPSYGINNTGQVVGQYSGMREAGPAFLYRNGQIMNLNNLIDPALGITLRTARGINNSGQIVVNSDAGRAYLLTPIPEPSTLVLLGVALLGLGAWVRRRPSHAGNKMV